MAFSQIESNLHINGSLTAQSLIPSAGSVSDAQVAASAAIAVSKQQQQTRAAIGDTFATTTATARRFLYRVTGATGIIDSFKAGNTTINIGAATISIQLKKNGANILSAAIVLDTANVNYVAEAASGFTSTALVVGDVLEVDITATAGGGTLGLGFFAQIVLREDPA